MTCFAVVIVQGLSATRAFVRGRIDSERGATAVEYGLLVGLIAAVIVGVVVIFGQDLSNIFAGTSNKICNGVTGSNGVLTTGTCSTTNTTVAIGGS